MKTKHFLKFAALVATTTYLLMSFIFWDLDVRNWGSHGLFTSSVSLSLVIAILACCSISENPYKQQDDEN
jgi:hypothetical protein